MKQLALITLFAACFASCAPLPQVQQLQGQIQGMLQQRQVNDKFTAMTAFFAERLDASAGTKTFSDKTGNCRLSWYDWLMRHPLESVGAVDEFTRDLHVAALQQKRAAATLITMAGMKLDADAPPTTQVLPALKGIRNPGISWLAGAISIAQQEYAKALSPLTPEERDELRVKLYDQSTGSKAIAPFFANKTDGRRICDLLEKMDRTALIRATASIALLSETDALNTIGRAAREQTRRTASVRVKTQVGDILFGGKGKNEYRIDELTDVCAIVDAGGDDSYLEGALTAQRPVLVIIDLGGNDTYRGTGPGIQGGAVLGISLLLDASGNDSYLAGDVAQGACLGGGGLLIDLAGNDTYKGLRRVQGSAVGGVGMLLDRAGNDDYRATLLAQGVGGPLGFGLLDDLAGGDHYFAGGKEPNTYGDTPGYDGWSQGVGVGPRGTANGGIGCLLDGGGDDVYEADYFSHGAAYWFALGFARDFGGNDQRVGSTRTAYDGGERTEKRFLRWGTNFGCHYAAGYLIDDAGNDVYMGDHASVCFNWDIGIAALIDLGGDDLYQATSSGVGLCSNCGLAILYDGGGNDRYAGSGVGMGDATTPYHDDPRAYNFAFLIDENGEDIYPVGLENGKTYERGWAGGALVDKK